MYENANQLIALVSFAFVASITPGPNNLMVMASGAAFGSKQTMPHIFGIAFGFAVMIGTVVLGLGAILQSAPWLLSALRVFGTLWLLWLAWNLASPLFPNCTKNGDTKETQKPNRPMRFGEAAMFQWVNPKSWTMAIAASSAYVELAESALARASIMAGVFILIAPVCNGVWMASGQVLHRLTAEKLKAQFFSVLMVTLVLVSALLINL